jgi:NAD(P)-dependent dehydrogenase (short-subunit alcohol dehydrogenase family)|uniref:SDR family NAD(P)-dependent oxidoreductase n=1 Tax=Candidatus Nanopelagicus sp. TaxID=2518620 RepID=UPI00404B4952
MKLQNEHVFVTGGANGIGAAIVLDVAQSGAKVSFCDLAEEAGKEYEKELTGKGFQVFFHQGDVANFDNLKVAHTAMVAKFGMVTGVVNNAGVNSNADPVEMTNDQWNRFFDVDLKSVWHTAKLVLPEMRKAKKGSIVNIASIHARMSFPKFFPYAAAKSGVIGLTRNLALDEGIHNIRTNAVSPGYTLTPLLESWFQSVPEKRKESMAVQPLGRMAQTSEIAKVVTFLLSADASFVNGADWIVDGGLHARFA